MPVKIFQKTIRKFTFRTKTQEISFYIVLFFFFVQVSFTSLIIVIFQTLQFFEYFVLVLKYDVH